MSIQERIDLVGNVSAQARAWARDLTRLIGLQKKLNGLGGGGGRGSGRAPGGGGGRSKGPAAPKQFGPDRGAFEKARAQRLREEARAQKQSATAQARADRAAAASAAKRAKAESSAPMFGPGRKEAGASAAQRQREEARASKQSATAQARAARQQSAAEAKSNKERARSQKSFAQSKEKLQTKLAKEEQAKLDKAKKKNKPANDNAKAGGGKKEGGIGATIASFAGNLMAEAASAAMSALAGLMKSMASTFVAAQLFREQSLAGLTILQKSGSEAKKTWDESFKLARDTGSTQQETMTAIQGMMASGFKKNDAVEMYKLMTAMSVVNPAANLEGIARAIGQIKNTGRLQGDELMQLADAGVNVDEVYNQLGKRLGKTRAEIMKMQEAGQIKSSDAIEAIKEAMKTSVGGDPEAVLKKRANSMTAILARLQAAPFTFFSGIEADPEKADRMKKSLNGLVDMLDPSTEKGARFAAAFGKMLDIISGPGLDAFEKLMSMIGDPGEKLEKSTAQVQSFGAEMSKLSGILDDFKSMTGIGLFDALDLDAGGLFEAIMGPLYSIPVEIMAIAEATGVGVLAIANALLGNFGGFAAEIGAQAMSAGYEMAAGLASGIASGASAAISAAVDMASSALAAARSVLEINSPSKVFRDDVGSSIPEGMAKGIDKGAGMVQAASAQMGDTAVTATQQNMASVAGTSRAMSGGAATPTQKALPFVGTAMRDMGLGGGNVTNNNLGGMRLNAPIMMSGGDATPQGVQMQLESLIQRGVQNFMNKSAVAA